MFTTEMKQRCCRDSQKRMLPGCELLRSRQQQIKFSEEIHHREIKDVLLAALGVF